MVSIPPEGLREATRRGAELLDKHVPGWAQKVKLSRLNMGNPNLCMLGQLFGTDVETAVASEMFPELWRETKASCNSGYYNGLRMVAKLEGLDPEKASGGLAGALYPPDTGYEALRIACAGFNTKCYWAEEVARRVSEDGVDEVVEAKDSL